MIIDEEPKKNSSKPQATDVSPGDVVLLRRWQRNNRDPIHRVPLPPNEDEPDPAA